MSLAEGKEHAPPLQGPNESLEVAGGGAVGVRIIVLSLCSLSGRFFTYLYRRPQYIKECRDPKSVWKHWCIFVLVFSPLGGSMSGLPGPPPRERMVGDRTAEPRQWPSLPPNPGFGNPWKSKSSEILSPM